MEKKIISCVTTVRLKIYITESPYHSDSTIGRVNFGFSVLGHTQITKVIIMVFAVPAWHSGNSVGYMTSLLGYSVDMI